MKLSFPPELDSILAHLATLYECGDIEDYDYAGAFILLFLSFQKPHCVIAGKRDKCKEEKEREERGEGDKEASFIVISKVIPSLYTMINSKKKRWINEQDTIVSLFSSLRLTSIPLYVNTSIVEWSLGRRPLVLLFHIPSPMDVLRMQCEGKRVVTILREVDQIRTLHVSPLQYMDGADHLHARDACQFLIHDLKHMEFFINPDTYYEQVGFFQCICQLEGEAAGRRSDGEVLGKKTSVRNFFKQFGYGINLWHKVEYVISDMNTYSLHLLKYLKAKWMTEEEDREGDKFEVGWEAMLDRFGIERESRMRHTANMMCVRDKDVTVEEAEELRAFFTMKGREHLMKGEVAKVSL